MQVTTLARERLTDCEIQLWCGVPLERVPDRAALESGERETAPRSEVRLCTVPPDRTSPECLPTLYRAVCFSLR